MLRISCLLFLFLSLGLYRSYSSNLDSTKRYSISGSIRGLPDGVPIYLIRFSNGDTVAVVNAEDNKFRVEGRYEEEGEMHFLKFDSAGLGLPRMQTWLRLYFDHQPIFIRGSIEEWSKATISGSPSIDLYDRIYSQLVAIGKEVRHKYAASEGDSTSEAKLRKELRAKQLAVYLQYPDSWAAADLAYLTVGFEQSDYQKLTDFFTSRVMSSYSGRKLMEKLVESRPENLVKENNIVPDFSYKDINGESVKIREVIKNSKFTLIDFWASWCKPCIETMPKLQSVHDKYSRNDFQILGISIDTKMADWFFALDRIKTQWKHGIDQKGEIAHGIFGIKSIPAYLLIDSSGRMKAFNCTISEVRSFGPNILSDDGLERFMSTAIGR